jgi:branched-chain amino acid transport system permease protein
VLARVEAQPPAAAAVRAEHGELEVLLRWRTAGPDPAERTLRCGFAPPRGPLDPPRLVAVRLPDGEPLGGAALVLLETVLLDRPALRPAAAPAARPPPAALLLQQAINGAAVAAAYTLLALAFTLVWSLTGRLHLAMGDLAGLAAAAALVAVVGLSGTLGLPLALAVPLAAFLAASTAALASGWSGSGAARRIWTVPGLAPLVATLGFSLVLREGLRLATGARERWLPPLLAEPAWRLEVEGFEVIASRRQVAIVLGALFTWAAIHHLLARTALGRALRAAADDPGMVALSGVDPDRLRVHCLALAGAAAGVAGTILLLAFGTLGPEAGFLLGLKGLTAAILGGLGSVHGAALGGLLIGALETGWTAVLGGTWRDVATFAVLALVLLLRPHGLLARPLPERNDRFGPG